ncbi:hypothetical protein, partial [Brevibacterium luteolum]
MSVVNISVLVGYLLLMVLVAAWFSRKSAMKDGEDFMLAGQSLDRPGCGGGFDLTERIGTC